MEPDIINSSIIQHTIHPLIPPHPHGTHPHSHPPILPHLAPRPTITLRMLSLGLSNKQIARIMQISERTVDVHRRAILATFRDFTSNPTLSITSATMLAISLRIIPFPDTTTTPVIAGHQIMTGIGNTGDK
jgi:DNA-binding CsgD family transcriptional regulator